MRYKDPTDPYKTVIAFMCLSLVGFSGMMLAGGLLINDRLIRIEKTIKAERPIIAHHKARSERIVELTGKNGG